VSARASMEARLAVQSAFSQRAAASALSSGRVIAASGAALCSFLPQGPRQRLFRASEGPSITAPAPKWTDADDEEASKSVVLASHLAEAQPAAPSGWWPIGCALPNSGRIWTDR
jgi:hypothetical protein